MLQGKRGKERCRHRSLRLGHERPTSSNTDTISQIPSHSSHSQSSDLLIPRCTCSYPNAIFSTSTTFHELSCCLSFAGNLLLGGTCRPHASYSASVNTSWSSRQPVAFPSVLRAVLEYSHTLHFQLTWLRRQLGSHDSSRLL